jgi:hypothetical protein
LRRSVDEGTLLFVNDAWDDELVASHLMLLADIAANTALIAELLEEDDGEETEEN